MGRSAPEPRGVLDIVIIIVVTGMVVTAVGKALNNKCYEGLYYVSYSQECSYGAASETFEDKDGYTWLRCTCPVEVPSAEE